MFHLDVEQKRGKSPHKCGYHTPSLHIFVANMKTTRAISLQIWNRTVWMMGLSIEIANNT